MVKQTIPFLERWRERMLTGVKTATARTQRYGDIGDHFLQFDAEFEIFGILHLPLRDVARDWYLEEGVDAPLEYVEVWETIHPRKGFVLDQRVWLHLFHRVDQDRCSNCGNKGYTVVMNPQGAPGLRGVAPYRKQPCSCPKGDAYKKRMAANTGTVPVETKGGP